MALGPGRAGWRYAARPAVALPDAPKTRSTPLIAAVRQHPDRHPRTPIANPGFASRISTSARAQTPDNPVHCGR